jgi:hypothetical protein
VVEVYDKKREKEAKYTSANSSKFFYTIVFTCQEVMAAEKMKRQWWQRLEKKGEMTTLFERIRDTCHKLSRSLDTWEESCWDESFDGGYCGYDGEEAMWLKECWLEWMTHATEEFSTYRDLVSVWANSELTRSGSNYNRLKD